MKLRFRIILLAVAFLICLNRVLPNNIGGQLDTKRSGQLINFQFKHYGIEEGLNSNTINCIIQDEQGFIWLGTRDGLVRYDGYNFKIYSNKIDDSTSLSNNTVNCIFEDSRGWLWIGTETGLDCFDRNTNEFVSLNLNDNLDYKNIQKRIFSISEDKNGVIWVGSSVGVWCIRLEDGAKGNSVSFDLLKKEKYLSKRFALYGNDATKPQNVIYSVLIDSKENIWVGSYGGLMRMLPVANRKDEDEYEFNFERIYDKFEKSSPVLKNPILNLLEDSFGRIWAKSSMGLIKFTPPVNPSKPLNDKTNFQKFTYDFYLYRTGALEEIELNHKNYLWVELKDKGFALFDFDSEKFLKFPGDESLQGNSTLPYLINSVYKDRNGNFWFGTNTNGLYKFDSNSIRFNKYNSKLDKVVYKKLIDMRFVFEDSHGDLWIANDGVYRCNRYTGEVLSEYWTPTSTPYWTFKNKIEEDGHGFIWIASEFGGLYRYDPYNNKMNPVESFGLSREDYLKVSEEVEIRSYSPGEIERNKKLKKQNGYFSENVTALARDSEGNIWSGAWVKLTERTKTNKNIRGMFLLSKIDISTNKILRFDLNKYLKNKIPKANETFYSIYVENTANVWLGTSLGLVKFNSITGSIRIYSLNREDGIKRKHYNIHAVTPDSHNPGKYLWIGTAGDGIYRFDKRNESFLNFTDRDGLPGNVASSILVDNKGNLWIGTNKGLCNVILDSKTSDIIAVKNYNKADGIEEDNFGFFYGQNAHRNAKGEMFFAGAKGITIFSPEEIRNVEIPTAPVATEFFLNFVPVIYGEKNSPLNRPISQVTDIELPHEQNSFALSLSALNFLPPEKNKYSYKLEGFQDDWIYPANERRAIFTNVPPGNYTFKARVAQGAGSWSKKELDIRISIIPPWYLTWWAYLFYGLSFLVILYFIRKYELNRQRHKLSALTHIAEADKLKELDKMKTDFFANISHEFRTPLSLIKGPVEQELRENKSPITGRRMKMALRNINRLFFLIKQLLDLSALESNKMQLRASESDIISFSNGIIMGFASWAERKNIALKIFSKQAHLHVYFDKDQMEKILNNLLSNAIKFTNEGGTIEVTIGLSDDEKSVEIIVKDTGIGIPADKLENVFNRFYQVDSSATREHEGTGIGLALVKELVELHGGEIKVESKEGGGTAFTIRIPLGKEHLETTQIMASVTESKKVNKVSIDEFDFVADDGHSSKDPVQLKRDELPLILIVEDHADFRTFIRETLGGDYRTIEAKNGIVGMEKAFEEIPDLIISDVMMPEMSGYELCEKIKNDERTCHIPVILLTAKAAREDRIEGLNMGADDYLSKPFDSTELLSRVNNLIHQRRKLQIYFQQHIIFKKGSDKIISSDEQFLRRALEIVEENIGKEEFSVDDFASGMNMSRSQLHRKINALTGKSATNFIRTIRLQRAAELLKAGSGNVTEIAFDVGFGSQSYFTRCFAEQFGCSPSEYKRRHG